MPSIVRPRVIRQTNGPGDASIVVPPRLAEALDPAANTRRYIPQRVTLGRDAPPFSGELREDDGRVYKLPLAPQGTISLGILRRPWNYVGFMVDPGDADATGLVAKIRVFASNMWAFLPSVAITEGGGPQAFAPFICGARAELVVFNGTADPIANLRGAIWGMSEA